MLARDFKPDRLEAVKEVALEFIDARPNDRFGVVAFSGESFTLCPLTVDYILVKEQIKSLKTGMVEDGTAIGDGLSTAINRLRESEAKSKVIILLTDGESNRGFIDPNTAAEIARVMGIRVYTIGAGTNGKAYQPVAISPTGTFIYDYADVRIDEALLKRIAVMTNAKSFRATNKEALRETYAEIDQLEKTRIDVSVFKRKHDEFAAYLWLALALLLIEFVLRYKVFKSIP
jgi:Ca-activated chloride channel family protein